jgi:lipopolysaccharide assembly protein A
MRQLIIAIIIALAAIIFALQNSDPVTVTLFAWEFTTSMALILIITLIIGVVAGLLFLAPGVYNRNKVIAAQKKRILELEAKIQP